MDAVGNSTLDILVASLYPARRCFPARRSLNARYWLGLAVTEAKIER